MLACDYDEVKPDILVLGKALSGGVMPVSAVLTRDEVMLTIKPGQHGSTYGGNPLACAVAMEALQILKDENLAENSFTLGEQLRERLSAMVGIGNGGVELVRGRGLLNAVIFNPVEDSSGNTIDAAAICMKLADAGLLAKPTHEHIIRLAPPLVLTEGQLHQAADIIIDTISPFLNDKQFKLKQ